MNREGLQAILDAHCLWLAYDGGQRANLSGANLRKANLRGAYLSGADLSGAYLSGADLSNANLRGANLSGANLRKANLRGAYLRKANLSGAYLSGADLSGAYLSGAYLSGADLSNANLSGANLRKANLRGADLSGANLRGAIGLLSASEWMSRFERDNLGWLVYKRIGDTDYSPPPHWTIQPGAILTEVVNPDRGTQCGCGVNFGTREWCDARYANAALWRCRIRYEDGPGVVVPYNTDGKARCERLELLEEMTP